MEKTYLFSIAVHPDGKVLASVGLDNCVRFWSLETGKEMGRFPVSTTGAAEPRLAFSREGSWLAFGSTAPDLHLCQFSFDAVSVKIDKEIVLQGHHDVVRVLAFDPKDAWLASGASSGDRTVRIWDLDRKEQIHLLEGHRGAILALATSRDGRWLASADSEGMVRIWDTVSWQLAGELTQGSITYGLAFSPDGSRLACACGNNTIRLWDTASQQAVCDLHGHSAYVHQVAFSPDGTQLVSCSDDFTVRIWDSRAKK